MLFIIPTCTFPPRGGSIGIAIWNMISTGGAAIAFAVLAHDASKKIFILEGDGEISAYEDVTPSILVSAAVIFGVLFFLNALLIWAVIKEVRSYLITWMVGTVVLEIGILLLGFMWLPSYSIPRYFWAIRAIISLSFLRTVSLLYRCLEKPSVIITIVKTDKLGLVKNEETPSNPV